MKIIQKTLTQKAVENNDWRDNYTLIVDGEKKLDIQEGGEPEDNTFGRDINFIYDIIPLMKLAYEAGKRNEELEITKEQVDLS